MDYIRGDTYNRNLNPRPEIGTWDSEEVEITELLKMLQLMP